MKTKITETQLDDATHNLADKLQSMGFALSDNIKCELNDILSSFLSERCVITTISDEEGRDDSKVQILKKRNVSCNANEEITYEIDRKNWEQALSEFDDNEEQALLDLQHQNKVVRLDYDSEITEINAEFDVDIEEV